jgi:hypothetical protein
VATVTDGVVRQVHVPCVPASLVWTPASGTTLVLPDARLDVEVDPIAEPVAFVLVVEPEVESAPAADPLVLRDPPLRVDDPLLLNPDPLGVAVIDVAGDSPLIVPSDPQPTASVLRTTTMRQSMIVMVFGCLNVRISRVDLNER